MKKRLLSIIIVLLGMVSGALADVTIDGTQDVERLSDYILGRNSSAFSLKSADLDDNGTVDITDLTLLIEKLKKVKR